ncbi:Apolipoprotein O family protein [Candida albicans]|uniref:MICOS complex subunit n=1 Tax=Candida albicans TaxID=5476 RepID=A0A8H6F1B8_CANAX|nr:Apolipoprotein O family protein [Candida albicans]
MFKGLHLLTPIVTTGAIIAIPTSNQMIFNESTRKRSFYEDDENVVPIPGTVTPAPATELETLGSNRIIMAFPKFTESTVDSLNSWADQKYHQYNKTERSVTDTVSSLHSKSEDLLPNSLYILVAVLSGTIAGRTRGVCCGLVHSIEETTESGKKSIENGTKSLKKSIANITGLNLDEEVSKK